MKQHMMKFSIVLAVLFVFVMSHALYATNGYFSHGYGIKYKGLAGAGVALSLGSLGSATNPAAMVFVGTRFDVSVAFFNPNRQYTVIGNPTPNPDLNGDGIPDLFGLAPGTIESDSKLFLIPAIGMNWMLAENSSFGVAVYGNGGMNTNYAARTFGFSPTGVDLSQLFVAPTYAKKFGAHAFGVTAILAYQRFQAEGLAAFSNFSSDAANLTNKDYDDAFGYGGRIGYQGEWLKNFFVGASYQIKTKMSKFDNYAGLFAEDGCFDIPSNWTAGLAYKPISALTLVFDVQQIFYSDCKAVNNSLLPNLMTSKLGDENGAGFGWEDMTVFKGGLQWQASKDWTLRAGYSNGEQPIPSSEVLFNILAPGVIEQHATFGFTKTLKNNHEISFAAMHGFSKSITGANPLEAPGQQTIELKMNQWEFEVGYSF
jgi:long-chain fatty acid transport protein